MISVVCTVYIRKFRHFHEDPYTGVAVVPGDTGENVID